MKTANVCFLLKDDKVLLAMKKRGFGVGKWNGVGGKIADEESVEESMVREAKEEIGVEIDPRDLEKIAINKFLFPEKKGWGLLVHCFIARRWKGEPQESEEMRPQWFALDKIPYEQMWSDDKFWLPRALGGEKLKAEFYFKGAGESVARHEIEVVRSF